MSRLHAWLRILPLILLTGVASALTGGCPATPADAISEGTLQILPVNATVTQGKQLSYVLLFTPAGTNVPLSVTNNADWSSSDMGVATITTNSNPRGVATAGNAGQTTISATYQGITISTTLRVTSSQPNADAEVSCTDATDPLDLDDDQTYTCTYRNNGPDTADDAELDIALSGGTILSVTGSNCTQTGNTAHCDLGDLNAGATGQVAVVADPAAVGQMSLNAAITGNFSESDPPDNADQELTLVQLPDADAEVTCADAADPLDLDDDQTYTCTYRNNGPDTALGAELDFVLNGGTILSVSGGTCTQTGSTAHCDLGDLNAGAAGQVAIVADPAAAGQMDLNVALTGNFTETNPPNNTDQEVTAVTLPDADLELSITESSDPISDVLDETYTVAFHNAGPETALDAALHIAVTNGTILSLSGNCVLDASGGFADCDLGDVGAGQGGQVTVLVDPLSAGQMVFDVTGSGNFNELDASDNIVQEITTVTAPITPNLAVTGSNFLSGPPRTPTQVTFTISETNGGTASGAQVTLQPSTNVNILSVAPNKGTCQQPAGPCVTDFNPNETVSYLLIIEGTDVLGGTTEFVDVDVAHPLDATAADDSDQCDFAVSPLSSLVITPSDPTVADGINFQFSATGSYPGGTFLDLTEDVAWSSSDTGVASVSNAAGTRGQALAVNPGVAIVTASIGSINDTVNVTITSAALASIEVTPASAVLPTIARLTQQYTAIATLTDGNVVDITSSGCNWTVGVPVIGSVDNAGLVMLTGLLGQTTVTCDSGGISDDADLFVEVPVAFDVTPNTTNLGFNQNVQHQALATMSDASIFDATTHSIWTSDNTAVATVSPTGLVMSQTINGAANITGTLGTQSDTSQITVNAATQTDLAVISCDDGFDPFYIDVHGNLTDDCDYANGAEDPGPFTIFVNVTNATLNSIIPTPAGACVPDLMAGTCSGSSFPAGGSFSIAFGLINPTGVVTLNTNIVAPGNFDPVAANDSFVETTTVNNATLVGLDIFADPGAPLGSCEDGFDQIESTFVQCRALGTFSDGSNLDLTENVTWTSSFPTVATVGNTAGVDKGIVATVSPGATSITASFGAINNVINITVSGVTLTSIDLAPNPASNLNVGLTQQFTATGNFSDGSTMDISNTATWSTSNQAIASVDATGLVRGESPGPVTIIATQNLISGSVILTVDPAALAFINVTPNPAFVNVGDSQQFTATGIFTDSTQQDISTTALWTTSDSNIATISNAAGSQGLATGVAAGGPVAITATQGGVSGDSFLTVSTPTAANIVVSCTDFSPSAPGVAQQTQCFIFETGGADALNVQVSFAPTANLNLAGATMTNFTCGATMCTGDIGAFGGEVLTFTAEGNNVLGGTQELIDVDAVLAGEVDTSDNSDQCDFPVASLGSLAVTPPGTSINATSMLQYTATGSYSDGSQVDITDDVVWSSSNTGIVTISNAAGSEGLATGVAVGTVNVTAAANGISDTVVLDVLDAGTPNIAIGVTGPFEGPMVLPVPIHGTITTTGQLFAGQQMVIQASPNFVAQQIIVISGNMTCPTPSFTLGNSVICTFAGDPANPIIFIVLGFGNNTAGGTTQTLTFTLTPGGGAAADDSVVMPYFVHPGGAQIIMVPPSFTHIVGTPDLQIRAFAGVGGSPTQHFDITEYVNWSSTSPAVATVNNTTSKGLVTCLQAGNATIQAFESHNFALGQSFGNCLEVTGVQAIPGFRQLDLGVNNTFPMRCVETLSDGSQGADITQDPSVVWSSSNSAVATVSNAQGTQGQVTSGGAGNADIICDKAGVGSDTARIEVNNTLQQKAFGLFTDFGTGVDTAVLEPNPSPANTFQIFNGSTVGPPAHSGADAVSVFGHNAVVGFNTSGQVASYLVDPFNPTMTEVNSLPVNNPGDGAFDPTGACYSSPSSDFFSGNGSIENFSLDANRALVSESSTQLPGILPRKLRFNPNQLLGKGYVCDGDNMHVMDWTLASCNVTPAGTTLTFVGRRDFDVDSQGEFLLIITVSPQFTGDFVLQRLGADGNPTGPPITVPLPTPAFQIVAHPALNVAYALGFFGNITPLTYDRATGMVTVGTPIMTPGVNAASVHPNGNTLFYAVFNGPTCQVPLDAQGIPSGPATCSGQPKRYHSIDFAPQ